MDTSTGCNHDSLLATQSRVGFKRTLCVLIFSMLWAAGSTTAHAEQWTNLEGTRTIEGRMVGIWGESVILELLGGRRVAVKMKDLRGDSRIQARKLAQQLLDARESRVTELKGNAAAASAKAPQPLPKPPAAPAYQAPKANAAAADFIDQIDTAITNGHLLAVYDALPPSYRKDVDEIVKLAASEMNETSWQGLVGTAQRLGDIIVTHQTWFLSSPRIQALPANDLAVVEEQILPLADLMRVGLSPDATNLNQLQAVSFGQWLAERDEVIAPYLAQLVGQMGLSISRRVTLKSEKDGTAVVSVEQDGGTRDMELISVEGYWVPKTIADGWKANVDSIKGDIASTTSTIENMGAVLGIFNPVLNPMANSQSPDQFHAAMDSLFSPAIQSAMITIATKLGKTPVVASNQNNGRGNSGFGGYDGGYGEDMGEDMGDEMGDDMSDGYGGGYGSGPAAFPGGPGGPGFGGSGGRPPSPGAPGGPGAGSGGRPPSPGAPGGPGAGSSGRPPSPGAPGGPGAGNNGRPPSPGAPGGPGAS